MPRPTRFLEDASIGSPALWGLLRPTILLPPLLARSLTPAQLDWVLLHELAHVRRRDLWVVAFQKIVTIVHFYNPSVWLANRLADSLREYACDDLAVALGRSSGVESGEAFVTILRQASGGGRGVEGALGMFGLDTRTACFHRVRRLLETGRPIRTSLGGWSLCGLILLAVVTLPSVRATSAGRPNEAQTVADTKSPRRIELVVAGVGGKPVAGARIRLVRSEVTVTADDDGKVVVPLAPGLDDFVFEVTIPGYGPYWGRWRSEDHDPPIPARFTVELEQAWTVGGIVVDPEGKPVKGVKIRPSIEFKKRPGDNQQFGSGARIETDAAGRWRYESVPISMAEVHLEIDHPDFSPIRRAFPRKGFGIEPGQEPAATIKLDRGLIVTGSVFDEGGDPIIGAIVRTKFVNNIREAKTGTDGAFWLAGCEARPARVVVSAKGRATDMKDLTIEPGMAPVNFAMKPGGTVRIRVLDAEGKPAPRLGSSFSAGVDRSPTSNSIM